jgi:hypothetical protein
MMRRILLLLTVVVLMVGMSVLPASAQPPSPDPVPRVGPDFICNHPDTGDETMLFALHLGFFHQVGFTNCRLHDLYD